MKWWWHPVIRRSMVLLAFSHLVVDASTGTMPLLYLLLRAGLSVNYAEVGLLGGAYLAAAGLTQPLFGILADRRETTLLSISSIVVISLCITLLYLCPAYPPMIGLAVAAGMASGCFHPFGTMTAAAIGQRASGVTVALYIVGGSLGQAIGPVIGGVLLDNLGPESLAVFLIPAGLVAIWLADSLRDRGASGDAESGTRADTGGNPASPLAMTCLISVVVLRASVLRSLVNYLPLFLEERGWGFLGASHALAAFLLTLAVGALIGGVLSMRFDRKLIISISLFASALSILIFPWLAAHLQMLALGVVGLMLGSSGPQAIVRAQQMIPESKGFASGVSLGLAFAGGALGTWLSGAAADVVGLAIVIVGLGGVCLLASIFSLKLAPSPPFLEMD